ncbi:MAG: HEAT repeat domain-containing protein [Planctomycetes bacterium]|nr:HEAT repeat domain-containing protein [Planctomycetota bacterium]MBL7042439.1 HEAT repeat domain-containing protein [Pirellulaceae bacterium]
MKIRLVCYVLPLILVLLGVLFWVKIFRPIRGLTDEDPKGRAEAVKSLATSWVPNRASRLAVALKDEDKDVRQWAADALGRIGNKAALAALIEGLHDEMCQEHGAIAVALGGIGEPALEPLIGALQHGDPCVRKAAAEGMIGLLPNIEDPSIRAKAIQPLIRAVNDKDRDVGTRAIGALGRIGEPVVEPMIHATKDCDYTVCVYTEVALKEIGEPAVDPLVRALQDEDIRVRRAAAQGLGAVLSGLHRDSHEEARQQLEEHRQEWDRHQESIVAKLDAFGPHVSGYRSSGNGSVKDVADLTLSRPSGLTDDDLVDLKGLPGLNHLRLGRPVAFTDTDVIVTNTKITDSGLEHLTELSSLKTLDLSGSQVTGPGLEHLKGLPNLRTLHLGGTQITDSGLEHLTGLTYLQTLDLRGCSVTDAGLEHLRGLHRLESLLLSGTQVTEAGGRSLKRALTKCEIVR